MSWWELRSGVVEKLGDIQAKNVPEDEPRFRRMYRMRLDENSAMEITAKNFMGKRDFSGELTQPNGRWVLFDPERPADKILDPRLLPLIEARMKEVRELDRNYMRNGPTDFTDEKGQRWVRA